MTDLNRGRTIFENLVEYSPPSKPADGKNYVFYFVPENDSKGYGRESRNFLNKFYANHSKKEVSSLEGLIDVLHAEVTTNGVQKIREIIIVAHGNNFNLLHRVVNDSQPVFKYINDYSLAVFQRDLAAGKFDALKQKRKQVIAHLSNDSWITVRACNFGNLLGGLYALYSFFGGRANIYAPRLYQFFGSELIMKGRRLESRLEVHHHLFKQHFFPRGEYTPNRKDIILDSLISPAEFSEPFELATMHTSAPTPEGSALLAALNERKINSFLESKFQEHDFKFTNSAKVKVLKRDFKWVITDTAQLTDATANEPRPFEVRYTIEKVLGISSNNFETATFMAQAHVVDQTSAEKFPFQLFLTSQDHDAFDAKLCILAFFVEGVADPQSKAKFDTIKGLLNGGPATAQTLAAEFNKNDDFLINNEGVELASPAVTPQASERWLIQEANRSYLVRTEQLPTTTGAVATALVVYSELDPSIMNGRRAALVSSGSNFGRDADTPGTELPASLDRLSIEELVSLIDYLRSPFKPGHSFYIHHAQEALIRRKGFRKWLVEHEPITDRMLAGQPTYADLSMVESEDKQKIAYSFDFNDTWREIKAEAPTTTAFQEDLFAEEDLANKLNLSEQDIAARLEPEDEDPESPAADTKTTGPTVDRQVHSRYFGNNKGMLRETPKSEVSCPEFQEVINTWLQIQNLTPQEMKDILDSRETSNGTSFWDVIKDLGKKYSFIKSLAKVANIVDLPSIPTSEKSAFKLAAKRGIEWLIQQEKKRVVSAGGVFLVTRSRVLSFLSGVLWAAPAIEIPWELWKRFLEEQLEGDKRQEMLGKLTAVRQWLRELRILTFVRINDFPDRWDIDISTLVSTDPVLQGPIAITRYFKEQLDEFGRYTPVGVSAPDRMKVGFDAGIAVMEKVADEIRLNAKAAVSDVLLQTELDACKLKVLTDSQMLNVPMLKALLVRHFADELLDKLPKIKP